MSRKRWLDIKPPFKVGTKIIVLDDRTIAAQAQVTDIYDPLGILPENIRGLTVTAHARCHPEDEFDKGYGVRLASNRARKKLYNYTANEINRKLSELDDYLVLIHTKFRKINEEENTLLLEKVKIREE